MKKFAISAALTVLLLAGCGRYNTNRGVGDSPVRHPVDNSPADVVQMPNHFGGIATKCDGHGHRIYVGTHVHNDIPPVVLSDPSCPGGQG